MGAYSGRRGGVLGDVQRIGPLNFGPIGNIEPRRRAALWKLVGRSIIEIIVGRNQNEVVIRKYGDFTELSECGYFGIRSETDIIGQFIGHLIETTPYSRGPN